MKIRFILLCFLCSFVSVRATEYFFGSGGGASMEATPPYRVYFTPWINTLISDIRASSHVSASDQSDAIAVVNQLTTIASQQGVAGTFFHSVGNSHGTIQVDLQPDYVVGPGYVTGSSFGVFLSLDTPTAAPANAAPTVSWTSAPATAASGQSYTVTAHGHDADGNLTQVNVWKNGAAFAFAGGGNGTDGDSGNATSDIGPGTITFTANAVDSAGATSATISHTVTISAANSPPTVVWSSTPGTVGSGQSYTVTAHGHDADGNLTQVNVWKNGVAFAFAGGGNGTDSDSGNTTADTGPVTVTFTANAVDAQGAQSSTISQVVTIAAPASVSASITATPASATAPGSTVISWSSANATAVSVSGNGVNSSATSGSQPVSGLAAGTYAYAITAQGPGGPVTRSATFTVSAPANQAPTIAWNTTPGTVASGESYQVSAHGHDADGNLTEVNVWRNGSAYAFAGGGNGFDGDSGNPSTDAGPVSVTYTAQAVDGGGLRSAVISQTVVVSAPSAVAASISVSPTSGSAPGTTTVTWSSTNATSVSVAGSGVNSAAASGSQVVTGLPDGAYTYTIVALGPGGPLTKTATFTVAAAPSVSASIAVNPANVTAPGSATISWSSMNATAVSVSGPGVTSTAQSGNQVVSGLAAGTYNFTITAQGPGGPASQTTTLTVAAAPPPASVSGSISANPTTATAPGSTTIVWSTANATGVNVSGSGLSSAATTGSQVVSGLAAGTYVYTLTAQGSGGPITRTATVVVNPAANVAGSITVSPGTMAWGGSALVKWTTSNATSVKVSGFGVTGSGYENSANLTLNVGGVNPGQSTWTLVANGPGGPITRTATINVTSSDGLYGSLTTNPTVIYSNQSATLNWTTTGAGFRWVHGSQPGLNGVNIFPAAVGGSTAISALPPGDYRFVMEYGPGSAATRMAFSYLTILGINRTVAATASPVGTGTVTGSGTYAEGSNASLSATPDASHEFTGWSGDASGAANPFVFTVGARDYNVVANFSPRSFAVSATVSPAGTGLVAGGGSYALGATATLSATPDAAHIFTGWSGDISGLSNPFSFTVTGATNVTANFAAASFALTTAAGSGGSVTPGGTYQAGAVVAVTATPDSTHRFLNWAGDASGSATAIAVTMDRAKSIQALFATRTAQTIAFDPPGDHGSTSPPFSLVATASSGLPVNFLLLSGPAVLTGSSVEVTGAGPVTLQANQPGDAYFLPAAPVNRTFNVMGVASVKYRGESRTLLRGASTGVAPPFVLEKP